MTKTFLSGGSPPWMSSAWKTFPWCKTKYYKELILKTLSITVTQNVTFSKS